MKFLFCFCQVTWMSSGGTKSVLHQDDLDNINCLFRGSKDLLLINPVKYGSKVFFLKHNLRSKEFSNL